ncbi:kinase-like protein [Thelephora ganbajun]|uniref:Kinase-like protein n=1 Tax=Thelephora ganbajun TaxID=370292 RepID=A0ACB6Z5J7_THEGA|nr:kinase-like protein [Thelephora ganbajun]
MDSTPVPHQLLHLYQISKHSKKFEPAFDDFYNSAGYEKITDELDGPELEIFINFLDEVLRVKSLGVGLFQKALHALWSICGKRGVLPKSHIISEGVSRTDEKEFASGGFANVWKGELVETNSNRRKVCLKAPKVVAKDGEKERKDNEKAFYEEVSIWMRLKHPNVVQCFGATSKPPQIVIDWMENGEVMDYVQKNPNASRTHLVLGVTKGLDYLHLHGVVHGDVKPQNILVNAKGDACLADFGLAIVMCGKKLTEGENRTARGHSSFWVAPETLIDGRVSKEADVFCYGLVAVEMFKGGSPWGQATAREVMTNITLNKRPDRPKNTEPLGLTTELWNCLTKCWCERPEDRIPISEVLALLNSTLKSGGERHHHGRFRVEVIDWEANDVCNDSNEEVHECSARTFQYPQSPAFGLVCSTPNWNDKSPFPTSSPSYYQVAQDNRWE